MNIQGKQGELRATVQVTRKATGKIETYELIGHTDPEQLALLLAEARKNRVHGAAGEVSGQGATIGETT